MSVYMIIDSKVKDAEKYREYIEKVYPIVERYGGQYHVRTDKVKSIGTWKPDRIIVIEFPSENHVKLWLSSDEYQAIASLREEGADTQAVLVEGMDEE